MWFSPERARQRFSLSAGTRRAGLLHLRELDLLRSATRTVSEDGTYISFARRRAHPPADPRHNLIDAEPHRTHPRPSTADLHHPAPARGPPIRTLTRS